MNNFRLLKIPYIAAIISSIACFMTNACFVYAETPKTVAEAAERICNNQKFAGMQITNDNNTLTWKIHEDQKPGGCSSAGGWYDIVDEIINSMFRGCDPSAEFLDCAYQYSITAPRGTDDIHMHTLSSTGLQLAVDHQTVIDAWCKEQAMQVIKNGMSKYDAAYLAYLHIVRNIPYDYSISGTELLKPAQSGYYALENHKGICATKTRLFRCMAEAVPFNRETGLSDWDCEDPEYLSVIIITGAGDKHQWAGIQFPDVGVRYYECTFEWPPKTAAEVTGEPYQIQCVGDPTARWEY